MLRVCFVAIAVLSCVSAQNNTEKESRCSVPQKAPKNIEKVISSCQDEIKYAILTEALESLNDQAPLRGDESATTSRKKRSLFNDDERRIAGCLLHCVFRKKKALNDVGFPTLEGLVNLYAEGVTDKAYVLATIQAVHTCLSSAKLNQLQNPQVLKGKGQTCDVSFYVFDCVSDKIAEFCGQRP